MKNKFLRKAAALTAVLCLLPGLAGCVDQHPEETKPSSAETQQTETPRRLIATSSATMAICDRLGLELVATCDTAGEIPQRYQGLPEVGTAMAPDAEKIIMQDPTDVIGPDTLAESIQSKYDAAHVPYTFIDLQSVQGMYDSIAMLGEKYGVQEAANELIAEYERIMADFRQEIQGKDSPRVLVLMGLPGAYIECTPNSYVGSMVELAGGESVVQDAALNFVSWNTEQLLELDPDVILLTAHGMPEAAMEMFQKEFASNDIWKHFRAVQEGRVYRLDYDLFNMSATFDWPQALEEMKEILYEGTFEAFPGLPESAD